MGNYRYCSFSCILYSFCFHNIFHFEHSIYSYNCFSCRHIFCIINSLCRFNGIQKRLKTFWYYRCINRFNFSCFNDSYYFKNSCNNDKQHAYFLVSSSLISKANCLPQLVHQCNPLNRLSKFSPHLLHIAILLPIMNEYKKVMKKI